MCMDTMLLYALSSGIVWAACIIWMVISLMNYNLYSFLFAFAILMLAPVFFELFLNIYGFLTSSSLLFTKHMNVCDKQFKDRFPIIYNIDYGSSLLKMETMHGLDSWLNFYVYRQIEEQEIVDSKLEEEEWNENKQKYEEAQRNRNPLAGKRYGDNKDNDNYEDSQRRSQKLGGGANTKRDTRSDIELTTEDVKFNPYEIKNFYHEPESPSRAFLLDFMSIFYLFKLCYSFMLTAYLDVPALLLPAWVIRWQTLRPLAKAAKGTVDGVCLAVKHGWAINLAGGYTHCSRDSGDMFNIYPDISLAIHYAKKWHPNETRRILFIDTSATQANGVARDFFGDDSVYILDFYNPLSPPKDTEARQGIHLEVTVGDFDNDDSYISKIRHNVSLAISSFTPELI